MKLHQFFSILIFNFFTCTLHAQLYIAGESYFSENEYVEYMHGNLPLILSASHGGYLKPSELKDRDCEGCTYIMDSRTQELTRDLYERLHELTNCYPYAVYNLLHRSKLDANRDKDIAADGDPLAEQAWEYYHQRIIETREHFENQETKALFLDFHGHGHEIQRIELGYLMSKSELTQDDTTLGSDVFRDRSSIRNLSQNNLNNFSFIDLLRGSVSLGTIFEDNQIPTVPSLQDPFPKVNDQYFSGGYNTFQYGSLDDSKTDAIQIEIHRDVRLDDDQRGELVGQLAESIIEYMELHYDRNFRNLNCVISTVSPPVDEKSIVLFPNPLNDVLYLSQKTDLILVYNALGQMIAKEEGSDRINLSFLDKGNYWIHLIGHSGMSQYNKLTKI